MDKKAKRVWWYLISYSYQMMDFPSGCLERVSGELMSFPFPLVSMKEIEMAKKDIEAQKLWHDVKIEAFTPLPYEGAALGMGHDRILCQHCCTVCREPQYQCPNCGQYLI